MKALIVDDSDDFIQLKDILEELGYEVIFGDFSGEEAVKKAGQYLPDIIFINITLKGEMGGVQAANRITDVYKIPVVFMTVFIKSCINKSLQIPEEAVILSKPLNLDKVEYCLLRGLNH